KRAVGKASFHGQVANRANLADAGDLFEAVNQVRIENSLTCFCFGIFHPRKRDVHSDNFVHAEPGIHFEHFEQAAPKKSRSHDENQGDGNLRRNEYSPNALTALGTSLPASAFLEALAQVAGCGACGGERSKAGGDRGGEEGREEKNPNTD